VIAAVKQSCRDGRNPTFVTHERNRVITLVVRQCSADTGPIPIRKGRLEDPSRLPGYVHAIVNRKAGRCIEERVRSRVGVPIEDVMAVDGSETPEAAAIREQQSEIVRATLNSLKPPQREVLGRFYLDEQHPAQICAEMDLTETQFRLLKTRAKQRFGEVGRRKMARAGLNRLMGHAVA